MKVIFEGDKQAYDGETRMLTLQMPRDFVERFGDFIDDDVPRVNGSKLGRAWGRREYGYREQSKQFSCAADEEQWMRECVADVKAALKWLREKEARPVFRTVVEVEE